MFKKLLMYGLMKARPKPTYSLEALETRHKEPDTPNFNDSTYFFGRDEAGFAMVARLGFRNDKTPEFWYSVKIPGMGVYRLDELTGSEGVGFRFGGMHFQCQEPGRHWLYQYEGPVQKEGQTLDLKMHLEFKGTKDIFNFDASSVDAWSMADTLAKEKWSKEFFQKLKEIRQMHYEQVGEVTGYFEVEGKKVGVKLRSIRLHSSGQRVWDEWNRHVWFAGVLDNGHAFNISRIRYNFLNFDLYAGFWSAEQHHALRDCDPFEKFAAKQIPTDFQIQFEVTGQAPKTLKVYTEDFFPFDMEGGVYKIREGIARFELDGVPGLGIAEFGLHPKHYEVDGYRLLELESGVGGAVSG